jgi:hypothetical protein
MVNSAHPRAEMHILYKQKFFLGGKRKTKIHALACLRVLRVSAYSWQLIVAQKGKIESLYLKRMEEWNIHALKGPKSKLESLLLYLSKRIPQSM